MILKARIYLEKIKWVREKNNFMQSMKKKFRASRNSINTNIAVNKCKTIKNRETAVKLPIFYVFRNSALYSKNQRITSIKT